MLRLPISMVVLAVLGLGCGDDDTSGGRDAGQDGRAGDSQLGLDAGIQDARVEDGRVLLADALVPETRTDDELIALLPSLACDTFRLCSPENNCARIDEHVQFIREGQVAVAAGDATVNRDNLVRCVRTLESGVCASSHSTLSLTNKSSACAGIFEGTKSLGETCANDLVCPTGSTCMGAFSGCTGTCQANLKTGDACGSDKPKCEGACRYDGEKGGSFCIAPRLERQTCESDDECADGLDCVPGGNEFYCTPRGRHGSRCLSDMDCPGGVCAEPTEDLAGAYLQCFVEDYEAGPGEQCGPSRLAGNEVVCTEGYYCGRPEDEGPQDWSRSCIAGAKLGETCDESLVARGDVCEVSAYCSEGKCVADLPVGSACDGPGQCRGEALCNPLDLKCALRPDPVGEGKDCDIWQECEEDLFCANYKCNAGAPTGETCSPYCASEDDYCTADNVCKTQVAVGEPCKGHRECLGVYDNRVFCSNDGVCTDGPTKLGDTCILTRQCPTWQICLDYKCSERLTQGQTCTTSEQCGEGLSCSFTERKCLPRLDEGSACEVTDWCTGYCSGVAKTCSCEL